jgi:hypothetical protein
MKGKSGLISGFHCIVNEICALPIFCAAYIGHFRITYQSHPSRMQILQEKQALFIHSFIYFRSVDPIQS